MVQSSVWIDETERKFVEAVHQAVRQRYGALAAQASGRGEAVSNRFSREYERIRNGLLRAKNQQVLRAELADLFSRAGSNKVLREEWQRLLPMLTGSDWQKARDLALFGLASYAGRGLQTLEESEENVEVQA